MILDIGRSISIMDLTQLANLGEFIGGVAVLATLGYLAVQIRQNTKSTRYLATQGLVAGQAEANFLLAGHDDLAALVQEGVMSGVSESWSPHAQLRFNTFCIGIYRQFDFAYHQYRSGQLEANVWEWLEYEIPAFLSRPGLAEWWARDKPRFSADFVEYVDSRLAEFTPPPTIPTMGAEPPNGADQTR